MSRAVLSLGSNLGDRVGHVRAAVNGLRAWLLCHSGVYETPPWGDLDQPAYLNAVVIVADADASSRDWLFRARALEHAAGRVRDAARRFGPRTLDVDVIAVWALDGQPVLSTDAELILPHPRAHVRAFVLRPWLDVEPCAVLPGHGRVDRLLGTAAIAADVASLVARTDLRLDDGEAGR
jgi:2-amino-4-hydroxy-6-hydroxymethyldihydropteridine diphosphokinase